MQRAARMKLLMSLTAAVWTAALTALYSRGRLTAKAPAMLVLTTQPRAVRVSVNGRKVEDGAWIQTPYRLSLPAGASRMRVWREGYQTTRIDVEADSGEVLKMDDVLLVKRAHVNFGKAQVGGSNDGAFHFEVDEGMERGETPLLVEDLVGGKHLLTLYPSWPSRDVRVRCQFTVDADSDEPTTIRIKRLPAKEGSGREAAFKIGGCEKIAREAKPPVEAEAAAPADVAPPPSVPPGKGGKSGMPGKAGKEGKAGKGAASAPAKAP